MIKLLIFNSWFLPTGKLTVGVSGATEEFTASLCLFNYNFSLFAPRAHHVNLFDQLFCVFTIRKARTGNKFAKPAGPYYQFTAFAFWTPAASFLGLDFYSFR